MLAFADPHFEATTPPSLASVEGVYFEGQEFTSVGDKVLVDTKLHARGRTTGIETMRSPETPHLTPAAA